MVKKPQPKDSKDITRKKPNPSSVPSAPKLLIASKLHQAHSIASAVTELMDKETIDLAMSFSNRFNISIYNWLQMLYILILEDYNPSVWAFSPDERGAYLDDKKNIYEREDLIEKLTLRDIQELATFEMPNKEEIDLAFKSLNKFKLPSVEVPVGAITAATFIEFGLLILLVYYSLYFHEARYSESFPAPGTIFGVFNRTVINQIIYLCFVSMPAVSGVLLARFSFKISSLNSVPAALVLIISFKIAWDLRYLNK